MKEAHGIVVTDVAFMPESGRGRELLAGDEAALLSVAVDSRCKLHLLPHRRECWRGVGWAGLCPQCWRCPLGSCSLPPPPRPSARSPGLSVSGPRHAGRGEQRGVWTCPTQPSLSISRRQLPRLAAAAPVCWAHRGHNPAAAARLPWLPVGPAGGGGGVLRPPSQDGPRGELESCLLTGARRALLAPAAPQEVAGVLHPLASPRRARRRGPAPALQSLAGLGRRSLQLLLGPLGRAGVRGQPRPNRPVLPRGAPRTKPRRRGCAHKDLAVGGVIPAQPPGPVPSCRHLPATIKTGL